MSVFFADVRGYTSMAEKLSSVEATVLLQRFYETASKALLAHEAVLGQMAGDEVMAFFVPGLAGGDYRRKAVAGARALLEAVGYGGREAPWLTVGVGICSGEQFMGNVGGGGFKDFTALGDVTNTAARLQGLAEGGEIGLCQLTYDAVADEYPDAEARALELKGKQAPVQSFWIRVTQPTVVASQVASPAAEKGAEYEAKAASFVKENRLPGAAVGIVHEGKLAWSKGIGFADVKKKRPADTKTLYRIASITKTFTATAVMQLRDEGKLALDDPLVTYLPELASAKSTFGPIEGLTIRRLLSHESGLQSEPPDADFSLVLYESEAAKTSPGPRTSR